MSYFKKKTITNVIRPLIIVDKIKHRGRRDTSLDRRFHSNLVMAGTNRTQP